MNYKLYIAEKLAKDESLQNLIKDSIEVPPTIDMGDYALPCFKLSKVLRSSPIAIAEKLKNEFVVDDVVTNAEAVNGYLNFKINRQKFAKDLLDEIISKKENFGSGNIGDGKTICIDFSSINIAKPFHIGHLSTTVIGGSLCKIFRFLGYKVVGINHLGDYGTQFGKLIVAYKLWSSEEKVLQDKLTELTRIYVKFHEEAEKDETLNDKAREYFKKIETGDKEANELFELFKKITLEEIEKIYKMLNVTFDSYAGESFYNDKMQPIIDELNEKGLLVDSEGAKVVDLEKYNMPPCLILKSDGSSLYATRDMAAAVYRKNTYDFYKCLYVVAYQQNLHFQQVFKTLELMGKDWAKDMEHVAFGMVSLEDGVMSTRKGKVVWLSDVLDKAISKAEQVIENKSPDLENKAEVAKTVGTGAVIFSALCNNKIKDIVFSFDKVINFEGETCPYIQYTIARCNSVLNKVEGKGEFSFDNYQNEEYQIVSILGKFENIVQQAGEKREPSVISRYALDLASAYNVFYFGCKINVEDNAVKERRLAITKATATVLKNALTLLGIGSVEKM